MKKDQLVGNIMLLIAALIWGTTFVAQSEAMDQMGPFTYQAARSILGALVLIPVIAVSDFAKKKVGTYVSPIIHPEGNIRSISLSSNPLPFFALKTLERPFISIAFILFLPQ